MGAPCVLPDDGMATTTDGPLLEAEPTSSGILIWRHSLQMRWPNAEWRPTCVIDFVALGNGADEVFV